MVMQGIIERAQQLASRIVLPEGTDKRIVQAAVKASQSNLAQITLLGDAKLKKRLSPAIEVIDPDHSPQQAHYANTLYSLRQHKGMSLEKATKLVKTPLYFASLMVQCGHADGMVAGAAHTTADVVRSAITIIGSDTGLVSSYFLMLFDKPFHTAPPMLFADCALIVEPDATELAQIAMTTAQSARSLFTQEPRVALLSFSTNGSARHQRVSTVAKAAQIVAKTQPSLKIAGDIQLDAAIDRKVGNLKWPDSKIQGKANVLIFPNLDAANIGYKLVERLAQATAIGPILQGLKKPVNDLSRGCHADDVYQAIAITATQCNDTQLDTV